MGPRGWRYQWLSLAALAAVALAAIGFAQTAAGRSLLRGAGLTSSPARYTELAFTHPADLPYKLQRGYGTLKVPLAIHNVEGGPRVYRWTATEQKLDGGTVQLDAGRTQVASGRWASLKPRLDVRCGSSLRVRVQVRIARPARSVGFWLDCPRGLVQQWRQQLVKGGRP